MKSVKNIKKYIKCPMKYYITTNSMRSKIENDNKSLRYLLADLNDLLQRNLRRITNEVDLEEIEEKLKKIKKLSLRIILDLLQIINSIS